MSTHTSRRTAGQSRPAWLVIALCWSVVVLDGYDLIVYGTTIPSLLKEKSWGLTPDRAGWIGSLAFLGMLVGAICAGNIADRFGRRRTILVSVVWFSVFTMLCGFASGPEVFGLLRFLGGLGLGGLVPSANALASEFVDRRHRSIVATAMMSGVPIGGSIAAIIALKTIPALGWEPLYFFAAAGLLVAAVAFIALPESPTWLRHRSRIGEAEVIEQQYGLGVRQDDLAPVETSGRSGVLRPPYLIVTVLFFVATTATMFAWYGLGTWLPKLTASDARFDLGSNALTYLLALNLGAVAVSGVTATLATRFEPLRVAAVSALVGASSLLLLTTYPTHIVVVYLLLILAGAGSHGTLCLIIAAIANHYPATLRGTALGSSLGGGRVGAVIAPTVAGWLLQAHPGSATGSILLFAAASGIAAVMLAITGMVTRKRAPQPQVREAVIAH